MTFRSQARVIFLVMFLIMFLCGAVVSRICLHLGMRSLIERNLIVTLCCYVCFLLLMVLYVGIVRGTPSIMAAAAAEEDWERRSGSGWDWTSAGDLDATDGEGCLFLLALIVLVVLVGAWIGIEGPALLLDEALAAAIAGGLAPKKGYLYQEAWYWRVIPRSSISLVIFLACSTTLLWIAERHCPGRTRLSEVVRECVMSGK